MDAIARKVCEAGHAAYVEQTGGGCATIYASREWEPRAVLFSGQVRQVRLPKMTGEHCEHFDIAAGPGWFDPHWLAPGARALGVADDFSIARDTDDGDGEVSVSCIGMSEAEIAARIVTMLRHIP